MVAASSVPRSPGHHGPHRPDIDGLRAVAILAVLGYHASSNWLPGGFVGVDIFFVISGYLISGIIFNGLQRGTFSFAVFYARRIKRIFPALLIVLALVTLFGWFSLFTDEYQSLGKHVAAGAGFTSNIVLWKEAGYFDPAGALKPLLHLWSLGIEEQFYLLWPPLLYFVWTRKINPLMVIVAITIGSFALNAYWIREHEVRTFYLPVTRLWELSLGSILAYVQIPGGRVGAYSSERFRANLANFNGPWFRNAQAALGVSLLVAAMVGLSKYQQFPGWWAALPTLGSFLLIAAGSHTWINRMLLGNPLMVFVGLISYPLYLWHWPLLSFQRIIAAGDIPTADLIATLALAFILAWLTYRFIERPIRSSRKRLEPSMTLVAGIALIGTIGYMSYAQDIQPRSAHYGLKRIIAASAELAFPGPHLKQLGGDVNPIMGQGKSRQKVLFLGDSQVEQYYPRIDSLLTNDPAGTKSVIYSSRGGCPPIPHVKENQLPQCDGLIEQGIELAKDPDIDTIVVAADWAAYFLGRDSNPLPYYFEDASTKGVLRNAKGSDASNKAFLAFESMVSQFTKANKTVYFVLQSPTGAVFRPRMMITRSLMDLSFRIRIPNISTAELVSQIRPVVTKLRQIASNTGAFTLDPIASLCNDSICPVLTPDGEPIYKDDGHLNPVYVKQSVRYLDNVVKLKANRLASSYL
jgi:peptidoglycan/LPS O-acetylase OafA/YrhL